MVENLAAGVVDTGDKFAAGVVDTGGHNHCSEETFLTIYQCNKNKTDVQLYLDLFTIHSKVVVFKQGSYEKDIYKITFVIQSQ